MEFCVLTTRLLMEKSLPEMWDKTNESITQSILLKGYSQLNKPHADWTYLIIMKVRTKERRNEGTNEQKSDIINVFV